jgi:hypothetical protein
MDEPDAADGADSTNTMHESGAAGSEMKWSFVFWRGAVAAIAALAGVLR